MAIKLRGNNDNLSFSKGLAKGDDGGYYIPSVNEDSVLSWVASESDMPEVESVSIRGEQGLKGESGVYVGTEEPTDDSLIWINPDGEESGELATKAYVDETVKKEVVNEIAKIEIPEPDLSNYATKDEIPSLEGYALKSEIPDTSGFITEIPSEYITDSELNAKGYLTEHQSLEGYAKTEDIPDVSGYQTESQVNSLISAALNSIGVAEEGAY